MTKDLLLKTFIVSSSLPAFLVTMTYLGITSNRKNTQILPYEHIALIIPLLYGIFGVINRYVIDYFDNDWYALIVGALFGIFLSIIGRFYMDLPQQLFGFTAENEYQVHIYASVLYAFIARFIMIPLQEIFLE